MLRGVQRLLPRRRSVFLDNERNLYEKQFMGSSADLGTVSFKSFTEDPFKYRLRDVQEVIRKHSQSKMDFEHKHRPESGDLSN